MSVPDIGWESLDIASDDEVPQIIQYADNGGTTVSPIERWSTFPWPKLEATREEVRERATVPSRSKMLLNKKVSFDSFAHTRKFVPVASSNYTIYDSGSDSGSGSGTEYIKVDETSEIAGPHIFEERLKCHVDSARYSFNDSYVDDNDDNRPIGITDRLQARHKTQYVDPSDILNDSSIFSPHFAAIESPEGSVHGQLRGIDTLANGAAVDTYVERIFDYPELARSPSPGIDGSVTKDEPTRPISPEPTDIHPSALAKNDDLDTEGKSLSRPKLKLFHTPESSAINAFDDPLHSSGDKLEQNFLGSHLSDASTLIPTFPQARRRCGPANNARSGVPNSSSVLVQEPNYDRPKTPTTSEIHHMDVFLQSPDNNYRFPTKQSNYSITLSPHRNSIYIMERRHCNHSIDKEISCFPDSLGSSRRSFGGESEPKERRWISRRVLDRDSASRRFSVDLGTLKGPATEADNARMDITPKAEVETQLESLKRRIAISFPAVANEVSKAGSLQIEHTPKTEPMIESSSKIVASKEMCPPKVFPLRQRNKVGNQDFYIIQGMKAQTAAFKSTPVNREYEWSKDQFVQMERIPAQLMQVKSVLDAGYTTTECAIMRVQGLEVMGKSFSDFTAKEMMTHPTKYEQTEATKIAKVTPQNKTSGKGPTALIKAQYGEAMVTEAIVEENPAISESKGKGKMEMNIPSTEDEGHRVGQNYRRTMGGPTAPISQKVNNVKRQEEKPYLSVQQSAANFCGMGRTSDVEEPKFGLGYKEWAKRKRLSGPIFIPSKETVEAWQNNVGTNKKYLKAPEPTWVTTNKNKAGKAPAKENVVLVKETRGITWPQFFIIVMIAASINYFFMTGHTLWEPTTSVTDHTATVTPSGQQHQSTEEINGPTSTETSTTLTAMPIITGDCVGYILAGSNEPTIMADPNNHAECLQAVKFMEAEEKRRRGPRYS